MNIKKTTCQTMMFAKLDVRTSTNQIKCNKKCLGIFFLGKKSLSYIHKYILNYTYYNASLISLIEKELKII